MNTAIDKNGLVVNVGNTFNVRVAKSKDSKEIVDFTQEGNTNLIFPSDMSLKRETEILEQSLIGVPTTLKYLGKTSITGDMNDITTPNGVTWYASKCLGGVRLSRENNKALITIETDRSYIIDIERDTALSGTANKVKFAGLDMPEIEIAVKTGMTVNEFIEEVNKIDGFTAILIVGSGKEVFNPESGRDIYTSHIIQTLFCGDLTEDYKKTTPKYIHFIIPKRGTPSYFNMLVNSKKAGISSQYVGCRLLKFNMAYANSALTTTSASIWASAIADFSGVPKQAVIDDVKAAYAQTNGRTTVYSCGVKANTVASMTNNFELQVEPQWNISNEAYETPNSKYTDSYDFEMMFNKQASDIFEKRVLENKNISVLAVTEAKLNGRKYQIVKTAKTLLGQPQYPTIADGVIQLQASGFTSVANTYDPYTSLMIITSDYKLEENYSDDEIKEDFPEYTE